MTIRGLEILLFVGRCVFNTVICVAMFYWGRSYERRKIRDEKMDKFLSDAVGRDEPKF
jgi:hypothetical protein